MFRETTLEDKYPERFFFARNYVTTIANNFHIIKELFTKGFHVQLQQIIRTQIEYLNNLIAFVGEDDFFRRFATNNGNDFVLSPKPIHSEKTIKKLFKECFQNDPNDTWSILKNLTNALYNDLSESTHGNIARIAIQSMSKNDENTDELSQSICGAEIPLEATINILRNSLDYFQISTRILWIQIEKKNMIDYNSPFLDFVDHYKDKFAIISTDKART